MTTSSRGAFFVLNRKNWRKHRKFISIFPQVRLHFLPEIPQVRQVGGVAFPQVRQYQSRKFISSDGP